MSAEPRLVTTAEGLAAVVDALRGVAEYALDTEFHREKTYFPQAALVQLAWDGGLALVDPLAVDIAPLAEVLDGPGVAVLHAAQQDLEVLQRSCGTVPARLFDTQLAAGFVGHATPSLVNLLAAELKVKLPKGDRLTDWLRRPLTADQLAYAAADVAHLLELAAVLRRKLDQRGRLDWAADECEALRVRPVGPGDPDAAWLRIKDHRHLRGVGRGVAQAVAAWRERRAAELDLPTRYVLADLAILGIAQRPPRSVDDLRAVRGIDERAVRGAVGQALLEAVRAGQALPADAVRTEERDDVERQLRPAVTLVSAWVSQLARDHDLDTSLLATRADIVGLLNGDEGSRLAHGWRRALVGDQVDRLVHGRAALAFDGRGGLRLVDVPA